MKERPQDIRKPMKEGAGTIAKKTAPTKLSGAWKERPQDIRKPMKEGAGTIAKKVSPAKLSPAGKERPQDIRKPLKEGSSAKKVSPAKDSRFGYLHGKESGRRKRPTSAARKQYKTEGPSRRPSKRA